MQKTTLSNHMEAIGRINPDAPDLDDMFPELLALDRATKALDGLIKFMESIRNRDISEQDFDVIENSMNYIIRRFDSQVIRAHFKHHLLHVTTRDKLNTPENKLIIGLAQIDLLKQLKDMWLVRRINPSILITSLKMILTIMEEQRTAGYLIYTSYVGRDFLSPVQQRPRHSPKTYPEKTP